MRKTQYTSLREHERKDSARCKCGGFPGNILVGIVAAALVALSFGLILGLSPKSTVDPGLIKTSAKPSSGGSPLIPGNPAPSPFSTFNVVTIGLDVTAGLLDAASPNCGLDGIFSNLGNWTNSDPDGPVPNGRLFNRSEVEYSIALHPGGNNFVFYNQYGRWSNGGAIGLAMTRGTVAPFAVAGRTLMPITRCGGATPIGNLPAWYRASDPVVAYSADGSTVYACSLVINYLGQLTTYQPPGNQASGAFVIHRSSDNGTTWDGPFYVAVGTANANAGVIDKQWITVHPTQSQTLYMVYNYYSYCGLTGSGGPCSVDGQVRKSLDGGATWSTPYRTYRLPSNQAFLNITPSTTYFADNQNQRIFFSKRTPGTLINALGTGGQMVDVGYSPALMVSNTDGRTWSQPRQTYASLNPYLPLNNPKQDYFWGLGPMFDLDHQVPDLGAQVILDDAYLTNNPGVGTPVNTSAIIRGGLVFWAMDESATSPFKGDMYVVGVESRYNNRRVIVSARTCNASNAHVSCTANNSIVADYCTPDPYALPTACVYVKAPLANAVLWRTRDEGLTFEGPYQVDAIGGSVPYQSAPTAIAVNNDGMVAVLFLSTKPDVDANSTAFLVNANLAFFMPTASQGMAWLGTRPISRTFDMRKQAWARGYMNGDYDALVARGKDFLAVIPELESVTVPADSRVGNPRPQELDSAKRSHPRLVQVKMTYS